MLHGRCEVLWCRRTKAAVLVAALLAWAGAAHAVSDAWTGGGGDALWSNSLNWATNPLVVPGTGDTATFNAVAGAGGAVIDLGAGVTIKTIVFDSGNAAAYTIGSGAVGAQALTLDDTAAVTMKSSVVQNELFNAAITLGTTDQAGTTTITNDRVNSNTPSTLDFAGNITGSVNPVAAGAKILAVAGAGDTTIGGIIATGGASYVGVTKSGSGTLRLSGANTYIGGTAVNTGALSFLNTAAQPSAGGTSVAAGATLGFGVSGAGAYTSADVDSLFANTFPLVFMNAASNVGIDTSGGNFTYGSNISSTMGLTKLGLNKLTLTGVNNYTGSTSVRLGTLELANGSSITSAGSFSGSVSSNAAVIMSGNASVTLTSTSSRASVGTYNVGNPSTMVMSGTSSFTTAGSFSVGGYPGGANGSGDFAMKDDARVTVQDTAGVGFYVQGDGASGTSHMLLRDRAVVNTNRFTVSSNFGTLTQTGGQVNCHWSAAAGPWMRIANGPGRWGWYNMTGGEWNVAANPGGTPAIVSVGTNWGIGYINLTGTAAVNIGADASFRLCSNQAGSPGYFGEVNLAGGTLTTPEVTNPDRSNLCGVVNFNGGTLKAAKDNPTFMEYIGKLGAVWNGCNVYAGGAVIDTNGFNITIAEPLKEPNGQGVTTITLDSAGTKTYVAPPRLIIAQPIAGDSGWTQQAQGFATLDDAGRINGIVLTNPGSSYTAVPAVTFDSGDAVATAAIGAVGGGGLTKKGAGTLTLPVANTFTGGVTASAGTLVLGHEDTICVPTATTGQNLHVGDTAQAVWGSGLPKAIQVRGLTMYGGTSPTGTVDVTNGQLVVDGTVTPAATIGALIGKGYNPDDPDNPWKGPGITSSAAAANAATYAVGYALNGDYGELAWTTWFGRTVNNDSVLVRFTYQGDADLNGEVTTDDFDNWKQGYITHGSGWLHGDLDYSGEVTTDDFDLWKQVYVQHYAPLPSGAGGAVSTSAVPEPGVLALLALGLIGALAAWVRRRSRK